MAATMPKASKGGFNTYLAYSGSDPQTAQFFEGISGKVIETQKNAIHEHKEERHEYNLLNADAIRRIVDSQAIMVSANKNPAMLETVPFFANPRMRKIPTRYGPAHIAGTTTRAPIKKVPLQ